MVTKRNVYLILIILPVSLILLLSAGYHDVQQWDEARNGVNAFEMLKHKDLINYYYNNELDTWNAKPPLMIWLIALSYNIFGFNEFALRFPSALSIIIFFFFCFRIVETLVNEKIAFMTCLILMSCKAILGVHIGLTGDFDSLLLLFLTASVYYFVLYIEKEKRNGIIISAILTGLAFYSKGTASIVFVPGMLLYAFLRNKGFSLLKDARTWLSVLVFLMIAGSWFLLVYIFGKTPEQSFYGSTSATETMIVHDTFRRLFSPDFDTIYDYESAFIFKAIDVRLNLWNYLFYLSLILGSLFLIRNRNKIRDCFQAEENRMLLLSFCLIVPLLILLTVAVNSHEWYLAPTFMFIAYVIVCGVETIRRKWKFAILLVSMLFVFTFSRHVAYIFQLSDKTKNAFTTNQNLKNREIIVLNSLNQDICLYAEWSNSQIIKITDISELDKYKGKTILLYHNQLNNIREGLIIPVVSFNHYCVATIR